MIISIFKNLEGKYLTLPECLGTTEDDNNSRNTSDDAKDDN